MKILRRPPEGEGIGSAETNLGCSICPFCGKIGITSYNHAEWVDGLGVSERQMRTDMYRCECGGEWESDPYEE